jgi:hypothetical protein
MINEYAAVNGIRTGRGNRSTSSTTNTTWPGMGWNPKCCRGMATTSHLSYGTSLTFVAETCGKSFRRLSLLKMIWKLNPASS